MGLENGLVIARQTWFSTSCAKQDLWLDFSPSWAWENLWWWRDLWAFWSSYEVTANSIYQHRDRRIYSTFSHLFCLKAKWYLLLFLQVLHPKWECGEVSLPCCPIRPRLSDHSLEKIGGLLEGVMDELPRKETGNFGEDGTVVCSLGLGFDVFQVFFAVFPYLITNAVWKSSLFCPINHLRHTTGVFLSFLSSRSALAHNRKARTVSLCGISENVEKCTALTS